MIGSMDMTQRDGGMSGPRWPVAIAGRVVWGVFAVLVVFLALGSVAEAGKKVDRFFPSDGVSGTLGGQFNTPRGVAVHQASGDVFVVDENNHRVQRFGAAGAFERAWGRDVVVDGGTGDLDPDGFETCTVASQCKAGSPGTAADGPAGEFDNPQGIAIDQTTGRVYVYDRDNRRIQQFTLDGAFVRAWGGDVIALGAPGDSGIGFEVCAVAADCKQGASGAAAGLFASTLNVGPALAVAPAGAPNAGDLFAGDSGNRRVQHFDPDAATGAEVFVRAWGYGVDTGAGAFQICTAASTCQAGNSAPFIGAVPTGQLISVTNLAVDAGGFVYVGQSQNPPTVNRLERYDTSKALASELLLPAASVSNAFALGATPAGSLLLGQSNNSVSGLGSIREYATPAGTPALVDSHMENAGLAANGLAENVTAGEFVVSSTSGGHRVFVLDDDGGLDSLDAAPHPPANVTASSATLTGSVNPQGFPTSYRFQYSTNGVSWTDVTGDQSVGAGNSPVAVDDEVTGLEPNRTYRVRMVVTLGFGNGSTATSEVSLVTDTVAPDVVTLPSRGAGATTATLAGTVNPNNLPTTYYFEYGRTTAYGTKVPLPAGDAGSGAGAQTFVQSLTGLTPEAGYHYRIVATNAEGTRFGADQAFTTRTVPTSPPGRGYELVSPPYKISGIGVGTSYSGPGNLAFTGHGAHQGDRFAVSSDWGSMLLDSAFAFVNDWAFADRVGDQVGWLSHSPITHPFVNQQPTRFLRMQTATADLSKVVWTGNNGSIPIFDEMATGWPQTAWSFAGDWEGRWELFGPTHPAQAPESQFLTAPALSGDGSHLVGSGPVTGMEGPGDPTHPPIPALGHPGWPDLVAGRSVYDLDLSGGLTDAFPVPGMRKLVNVCTGEGPERTAIPSRTVGGLLEAQACPGALPGRDHRLVSDRGASLVRGNNAGPGSTRNNLVSADGRRVFFMAPDPDAGDPDGGGPSSGALDPCGVSTGDDTSCPAQLYVRERGLDGVIRTRWVSRAQPGLLGSQLASLTGPAIFEGASEDGSRVFFRTNSPLTVDDPNGVKDGGGNVVSPPAGGVTTGSASNESWDLYMFELAPGPDGNPATPDGDPTGPGSTLTRITAGPTGIADPNGLQIVSPPDHASRLSQGILRFASEDGSRAYFAVSGQLPGVSAPSDPDRLTAPGGDHTTENQANLYAYDTREPTVAQRWRFVARLPRPVDGQPTPNPLALAACATTAVTVSAPLTDPNGQSGAIDFATGGRNCVRGTSDGAFVTLWTQGQLLDGDDVSSVDVYGYDLDTDELVRISAAQGGVGGSYPCGVSLPGTVSNAAAFACHGDGGLESGGDSRQTPNPILGVATDPSVAGDRIAFFESRSRLVAEDSDDAYDVYEWRNGDLSLVTTGVSASDGAIYRGNDATGRNVYFATVDSLSWQDVDAVADVYVARQGSSGIPRPAVPVVCSVLAGGCQGAGGGAVVPAQPGTRPSRPNGNAVSKRKRLVVLGLSRRALRRAARTGVLRVSVRVSEAGKVGAVARGRIGKRTRRVARDTAQVKKAGKATLRLRLNRVARQRLGRGGSLRLSIEVTSSGARPRTMRIRLKGASS